MVRKMLSRISSHKVPVILVLILACNLQYAFTQQISSGDPMPREYRDGLWWVLPPGNSTHPVEYRHPDNYHVYYPMEINKHYVLHGSNGLVAVHWSCGEVQTLKGYQYPMYISGFMFELAALCAVIPEPVITKKAGVILSFVGILFGLAGVSIAYAADKIETELGDGWIFCRSWEFVKGGWHMAYAEYSFGELENALNVQVTYLRDWNRDWEEGMPYMWYRRRFPGYWTTEVW